MSRIISGVLNVSLLSSSMRCLLHVPLLLRGARRGRTDPSMDIRQSRPIRTRGKSRIMGLVSKRSESTKTDTANGQSVCLCKGKSRGVP